jgi:hypothetical protein
VKFQVPQFIETETKLIGPLTLKQFLFVAGGAAMMAMEFIILSGVLLFLALFVTAAFFGALAFVRIDGQPFINYLAYMIGYILGSKQYVFRPKQDQSQILPPSVPPTP